MSVPQWLTSLGIPEGCISQKSSAQERGRSFSIHPQTGDQIWRVQLDGCWLQSSEGKRVDYLFWGRSGSGRKVIILVELKGKDFGKALQQIESTLERLCKQANGKGIHDGPHKNSPGHDYVRAYVVLSKGKGAPLRLTEHQRLQKRYGVIVRHHEQCLEVDGIDALP